MRNPCLRPNIHCLPRGHKASSLPGLDCTKAVEGDEMTAFFIASCIQIVFMSLYQYHRQNLVRCRSRAISAEVPAAVVLTQGPTRARA